MNEKELLTLVNVEYKLNLEPTTDTYCRWDAESTEYIVELKARRAHYDTQIIEYKKLEAVKYAADSSDREALYITSTPIAIMVFNVSALCEEEYNFNWENKRLPSHTDFGKCAWVDKKVGYINNEKFMWRLDYEGTN